MSTLDDLNTLWETTQETPQSQQKKDYKELEDGTYTATVKEAGTDSNSNGEYVYVDFYVPEKNIRERGFWNVNENEGAIKALKGLASSLGLKIQSPAQFRSELPKTKGYTVEIAKKTNGKYKNIYVNKVLAKPTEESSEIPF